nr:DnaJ domain-containing protein [Ardenticatena sp.]
MAAATFREDFYNQLGISPRADETLIRRQYRRLARLLHPDTGTQPDSAGFLSIQEAYDILSDPIKRREYDHWLREKNLFPPFHADILHGPHVLRATHSPQRLYMLLDLRASKEAANRPPIINLVLVIDQSSSMRGERLFQVRQAARMVAERLGADDYLSIVAFNDWADVVLPAQHRPSPTTLMEALNKLQATGGTEIARGLEAGFAEAQKFHTPGSVTQIILLTDGNTYGDEDRCIALAHRAAMQNMSMTLLGIGTEWNDHLLDKMADISGGQSYFLREPRDILRVFEEQLKNLRTTIASHMTLSITTPDESELMNVYEVSPGLKRLAPQDDGTYVLGALYNKPPRKVLIDLKITLTGDQRLFIPCTLDIEARLIGQTRPLPLRLATPLNIEAISESKLDYPEEIIEAARRAIVARLQEQAWEAVSKGDVQQAEANLALLVDRFLELGERDLAQLAEKELSRLRATGELSPEGTLELKYGTRMLALPAPPEHQSSEGA